MKFVIINQPLNNRGDESAHRGLVNRLLQEFPECNIEVLFVGCNQNSVDQFTVKGQRTKYTNIASKRGFQKLVIELGFKKGISPLYHLHPTSANIIKVMKSADVVVCAPGGICMGGFQNWNHLFMLHIAKRLHKPIAYYGRSVGPFPTATADNRRFKSLSQEILDYMQFISIRDTKTEEIAKSMNIDYKYTVDSAFLREAKVDIPQAIKDIIKDNKYFVFVPNLLIWHYAYKGRISKDTVIRYFAQILEVACKKYPEHKIIMLPQTFNYKTYNGDDIHFFNDLAAYVKKENLHVIPDTYSSDIQQTIIKGAEFMIGARYHSVVFALNNNTPFVALSYEHKISGLLERLKKTDCMIDITKALDSEENIEASIKEFEAVFSNIKKDEKARDEARRIASACMEEFKSWINNKRV